MGTKYSYNWTLKDAVFTKDKGKVVSCFSSGGGSSMGYELAGFDVIGCVEIDPRVMATYIKNKKPKYPFLEGVQVFKNRTDLPAEFYNLDILDGSPPCSSFSISGNRSDDWGKEKKFREGQSDQVLDTLFFDFIEIANKLKPKVVVAENVKGLMMADAIQYVRKIYAELDAAGYYVQHWILDSSKMGVPQKRERVFFIALRKDLATPFLKEIDLFTVAPELILDFNEPEITYGEIADESGRKLTDHQHSLWLKRKHGDDDLATINERERGIRSDFNAKFIYQNKVLPTITANGKFIDFNVPQHISDSAIIKAQSFPSDYDFLGAKPNYLCGMSVPPLMTAKIAACIYEQWLSKI